MGFFDSFKRSFDEESQNLTERQKYSSYRTVKQQKNDHFNELNSQSDSILLNRMNSFLTSDGDKVIIDDILRKRGYKKAVNGTYHRL